MFFFAPLIGGFLGIYILAAILPAIILMVYIYRKDRVEKEPGGLLFKLFLLGILAAFASMVAEMIGERILGSAIPDSSSRSYVLVLAFLVVAVAEEGFKFLFCYKRTWKDPNFDCRFDGIVYMVFTSLGFAAIENVMYVFSYGLSVAIPRALLSVPGHMGFAVVAGVLYGRARMYANQGMEAQKTICLITAYIGAVFLHGFYDTCAMMQTVGSSILFYSFVIIMYILIILLIKDESKKDAYL